MNRVTRKIFTVVALTASMAGITASAIADGLVGINLKGGGVAPDASGVIIVENHESGADTLLMQVAGLEPHTRYTLFITQSTTPGALPAQFLSEFTTNRSGQANVTLITEIGNAFSSANQSLENEQGVADVAGAGGLANDANTIALNWFRIYAAEGGMNVFGGSEAENGGGLALTSVQSLQ